jgi:agmatine deiminase
MQQVIIISGLLPERAPRLFAELTEWARTIGVPVDIQAGTNDIWIRDYYPVALGDGRAVSFVYEPDYLRSPRYRRLKTTIRTSSWFDDIIKSDLVVDGGNVCILDDVVFMTDRIFCENASRTPTDIAAELERVFGRPVCFVPADPEDPTGHIDGMLCCVGNVLFVNDYSKWQDFQSTLDTSLRAFLIDRPGYVRIDIPFRPARAKWSAVGDYVNLLAIGSHVLVPAYGVSAGLDAKALDVIAQALPNHTVQPIDCSEIGKEGGAIHCVTATAYS